MNLEPQKFFIGVVDFFAILMPGALVAYLGKDWAAHAVLGQPSFPLQGAEAWLVFFFASYLLGHFAFLLGAKLDDWLYNPLRKLTYWGQLQRLAKNRPLAPRWLRKAAESKWLFGSNADAAVMQAQRIKARALQQLDAVGAINAFQWTKARLSRDHPPGLVTVQRFEADSKFFRSLAVVLTVLAAILAFRGEPVPVLVCTGFLLAALWRYLDQRFKATQQAYWFLIMLEGMKDSSTHATSALPRPDGLTHAGGVIYRSRDKVVEYLLVQARKHPSHWVLPKGHIEPGEDPRVTAVREVKEETGQWAWVVQRLDDSRLGTRSSSPVVRFYLMEAVDDKKPAKQGIAKPAENRKTQWLADRILEPMAKRRRPQPAEDRKYEWLELGNAKERATFDETKILLEKAERLRRQLASEKVSGKGEVVAHPAVGQVATPK
jgi:8-oxo-dGTP pyrophosphatase MutT (NUDIX family)